MHPFVRDLYRRFITVGREYPGGMTVVRDKVRTVSVLRTVIHAGGRLPDTSPTGRCLHELTVSSRSSPPTLCAQAKAAFKAQAGLKTEDELFRAVAAGRRMVQELAGVTQLAKYRAMRRRYGGGEGGGGGGGQA